MQILKAFSVIALALAVTMSIGCGGDSSSDSNANGGDSNNNGGTPAAASGGMAATDTNNSGGAPADNMDTPAPSMMCDGPAVHTAPAGDYSPAARISALEIPKNVAAATEAGCGSVGSNAGTGLSTLVALAGDLNTFVQKNDMGEYELLLLAHMTDWAANANAGEHKLQLFVGEYKDDKFLIDLDSFNEKDPAKGAKLVFDASVNECNVTTKTGTFSLDIAIADGLDIALELTSTTIKGQVSGNEVGFALKDTVISGYLSSAAVEALVNGLKTACEGDMPPSLCGAASAIIGGDDAVKKVVGLMKGYDTKLDNGTPAACDKNVDGDCNAVSVCLKVGAEPVTISGLSND